MSNIASGVLTPRGLQRRLKQHLLRVPQHYFAACVPGFENELVHEIEQLPGVTSLSIEPGGVSFSGSIDLMYHANLHLRTAHRVLLRIATFLAQSHPMLYHHTRRISWERYLGFCQHYSLRVSARASRLLHKRGIADTIQQAISRRMGSEGLSPLPVEQATPQFYVRVFQDRCTISLNTSGDHLHKRGYRQIPGRAPIRETLAAACILRARIPDYDQVFDPFCGSGTLLIETAQVRSELVPGGNRTFAFQSAPFFNEQKWDKLLVSTRQAVHTEPSTLLGLDQNPSIIEVARDSAIRAGVSDTCTFSVANSLLYKPLRQSGRKVIFSNLPYGDRILVGEDFFDEFGGWLRKNCVGWDVALITHDPEGLVANGVTPNRVRNFSNGGIAVALVMGTIES